MEQSPIRNYSHDIIVCVTEPACADGTTEGLQGPNHRKIAACEGSWTGHIDNATSLCARGWRVCGWLVN